MISVISAKILIMFSLFFFKTGQQASLKPFQFQCYKNDICIWPLEYCSSKEYEQRCIPCLRSVCSLGSPPLQCLYNCSLIGQKEKTTEIVYEKTGDCIYELWLVLAALVLCVIVSVPVTCLAVKFYKLQKTIMIKEKKDKEMQNLITSQKQKQEKEPSVKHNEEPPRDHDSYAKRKFTDVPPTRDSASPDDSYKPTTHLDKPSS